MDYDVIEFSVRFQLKTNAHPAMPFICLVIIKGRNGIGKSEKCRFIATLFGKTFDQEPIFLFQHRYQPGLAYITPTFLCAIDGVRKGHIVSANGSVDSA